MQPFQLQPTLEGEHLYLRPLDSGDFEALYAVASDPLVWEQHPNPLRYMRPVFEQWFEDAQQSGGTLVVIDKATDQIIGSSRYYHLDEIAREVAIGFTFLGRKYWGGATNGELKKLMLDHAFRSVNAVWFHVGPNNLRSQMALKKIGAKFCHRGIVELSGGRHESFFYKISRFDYESADRAVA
jgi:RimJ/RimL family protein N-acetyltransferase